MAAFMHAFSETDKLEYHGTKEDDGAFILVVSTPALMRSAESLFRFNCFNVGVDDPAIGLLYGELAIPGLVIKHEVFDPIIGTSSPCLGLLANRLADQVLSLLAYQLAKVPSTTIDALILVGGFAASEYLFKRVQQTFGARIHVIERPNDCDVATLQGAARYGLGLRQGKPAVSNVISPRSYIMSESFAPLCREARS